MLGSNQRRLSRRFYIPEGAGRGQGVVCPFFFRFGSGFQACRKEGRGQGGAPGWTNDLDAGSPFRLRLAGAGNGIGLWRYARPVCRWCPEGRLSAAFIPSRVPAAGCRGGMGRVRVRAAGSIRQAAGLPGGGGQ